MAFFIEQITADPKRRIIVSWKGVAVQGWISGEITSSLANDYGGGLFDRSSLDQAEKTLNRVATTGKSLYNLATQGSVGSVAQNQVSLKDYSTTEAYWSGSQKFKLPVTLMFVALREGQNPLKEFGKLFPTVLPSGDTTAKPPNEITGDITVKIGTWMRATGLIVNSMNYTISKEITQEGYPLYVEVSLEFESRRMLDYRQVRRFFKL